MRQSRFSEEQIIAILREQEVGARTEEVCRRHGISTTTFYKMEGAVRRAGGVRGAPAENARGRILPSAAFSHSQGHQQQLRRELYLSDVQSKSGLCLASGVHE